MTTMTTRNKLNLKPEPIMWTMGDRWLPESTERDGLRFTIKHDYYGGRATSVYVGRASDDLHLETVVVTNHEGAEKVVRTWSLEVWRAAEEAKALARADRALSDHRAAMTRLNLVRSIRVEAE